MGTAICITQRSSIEKYFLKNSVLTDSLCSFKKFGMLLTKEDTIEVQLEEKKKKRREKKKPPKQKMSLIKELRLDIVVEETL